MALKKSAVKGKQMGHKPVPQITLQHTGKTDNEIAPQKPATGNTHGQKHYISGTLKENGPAGRTIFEGINGSFNKSRSEELEKIHTKKGRKPQDKPETVAPENRSQKRKVFG